LDQDARLSAASIRTVFHSAREISQIAGELPTQNFAILRVLLAILQRSVLPRLANSDPIDVWQELWKSSTLPLEDIDQYLERHRSRFDLLSAKTPFGQVADLRTAKEEAGPVRKLIAEVPDGHPFFTVRTGNGSDQLDFAEAARWIIHVQAFDTAGIKSGVVGDPTVKGGKSYPIGTGWAGKLGGVYAEGPNLKETLLLNLVLDPALWSDDPYADVPLWEQQPLTPDPTAHASAPAGPAQLYTWPSRAVRLIHDGDKVTGAVLTNSLRLDAPNKHQIEPMSMWRRSAAQEKALRLPVVFMPKQHQPDRALWRGLEALLPESSGASPADHSVPAPGVLDWIGVLRESEALAPDTVVGIHAVGISYGSNNSVVDEVIDDALSVHAALLDPQNRQLRESANRAVAAADGAVWELGRLATNIDVASGSSQPTVGATARAAAYFALDQPFRAWLAGLGLDSDLTESLAAWETIVRRILRRAGEDLERQAPPNAFTGHPYKEKGKSRVGQGTQPERWMTVGRASAIFRRRLALALPNSRTPDETKPYPNEPAMETKS
jgi:CRISPR system Cascade subunit CasA